MSYNNQLLQGNYLYFNKGQQYSEEDFTISQEDKKNGNYEFRSEILSRVSTGEFLKINVQYTMTHSFEPIEVTILRYMGSKRSSEFYRFDLKDRVVHYNFKDKNEQSHKYSKNITGKFHIATPSMATSMLMTLSRKIDPVQRTPYAVLTSDNFFDYMAPCQEKIIYLELMSSDPVPLKIHKVELNATICHMFQHDKSTSLKDKGTPFYLSKHFSLPYLVKPESNIEIRIDKLRSTKSAYDNIFKAE